MTRDTMATVAKRVTNFRLSEELREALDKEASSRGVSITALVEWMLREGLGRFGRPVAPAARRRRQTGGADADTQTTDQTDA